MFQAGQAQVSDGLSDVGGGVRSSGVCLALTARLHHHALLSGRGERRRLPHAVRHT